MAEPNTKLHNEDSVRGTIASYTTGFVMSLVLTLTAYFVVVQHNNSAQPRFSHQDILMAIFALALIQLFGQLIFFLHLDRESKPRWNLMVASFAVTVVLIVVLGSLWIMHNMNYHHPDPMNQTDQFIIKDEGFHY